MSEPQDQQQPEGGFVVNGTSFVHSGTALPRKLLAGADKRAVLSMWARESQKRDFDLEEFCETNAGLLGVSAAAIRKAISNQQSLLEIEIRTVTRTEAQRIAGSMGASVQAAIEALNEGLQANKERLLIDKETGRPILDPNGAVMFTAVPDHPVRVRAAAEILKIYGAYAPKQLEVSGEVHHKIDRNKTPEELMRELAATYKRIEEHGYVLDVKPVSTETESAGDAE